MNDSLARARNGLQFADVYQERIDAWLVDGFDPKFDADGDSLLLQFKHHVAESNVIEIRGAENEDVDLFRVFIDLGVRFVRDESSDSKASPVAQIEVRYRADYRITDTDLKEDEEALTTFALENASFHVWPFWREFAMSQGLRMNLPKIALPLRVFPHESQRAPSPADSDTPER